VSKRFSHYSNQNLNKAKDMPLKDSAIKSLRKKVGDSNVLTDPEDLYVYSFEHLFKQKQYPDLEAVVKTGSDRQIKEILELAQTEDIPSYQKKQDREASSYITSQNSYR
jgi:hypothetical protein